MSTLDRVTPLPVSQIPGPRGLPLVGILPRLWREGPLTFLLECTRRYGDVVHLQMGPRPFFFVTHPAGVKHILQDNHRNYAKGYEVVAPIIGKGLVSSEGEFWLRQRRLMQPAFHRHKLAKLGETFTDLTTQLLSQWEERTRYGATVDLLPEMVRLTQQGIVQTMFGVDIPADPDEVGRAFGATLEHMNRFFMLPIRQLNELPTPAYRRYQRALRFLDTLIYQMIAQRRAEGEKGREDLLSMLVMAQDEESGEGMSEQQIRDEIFTIYLAGHETTANALAWVWYYLSKNPQVRTRLEEEVDTVLAGRVPTVEDLPQLPYARMIFEETLRLRPSAWMFARRAIGPDEVGGYHIPAGSSIMLSPYVTHHRADVWENPEGFEPERFAPGQESERERYAYYPFGGGPRLCIGNNFALLEAHLIITMIAQRFRLDLVPGHPVKPKPVATLHPDPGVWVTLHPR